MSVDTYLYIKHARVRGCDCSRQDKRPRHRKETAEAKFSQVVSVHEFVTQRLSGSGSGSGRRRAVLMCCCRSLFCLVITPQGTRRVCVLCVALFHARCRRLSPSQLQRVSVRVSPREAEAARASQPTLLLARLAPTPWLLLRLTTQHHHTTTRPPTTTTTAHSSPANRVQSPLIHAKPH